MADDQNTDVFNVVGNFDKPNYVGGDTMTITLEGDDIHTSISQQQVGPITIPIMSQKDGTQSIITVPAEFATITTVEHESVVIDTSRPIVDDSPTPRVWTVAADKLSVSAVA